MAGDPRGLAIAYDRYADPLYQYCWTLLRDPADAADAVQDAFVIAASRLDGLRDPGLLRAWLYALARNEALRILRSNRGASALHEAPPVTDDSLDIGHAAKDADLRALFEDAADGLNPGEREAIELELRQGLDPAEVAATLGVSPNRAHALLARAREQLGMCLGVLLVGRVGRDDCGELDSLLAGWDGRLTVVLRKRVHRHVEHCAICGTRQAAELRPARLFDLSPDLALAAGAEVSLRLAARLPEDLRAPTITIATSQEAGAAARRAAVLSRAGAFNHSGFPKPVHGGAAGPAAHGGGAGAHDAGQGEPDTVTHPDSDSDSIVHAAPTPGTLSESPQGGTAAAPESLALAPDGAGAQIDLSAGGSGDWDVQWSVTVANDSGGAVSVSSAQSGTLTPTDATATLMVTAHQFILCGSSAAPTITVEPGGAVYSVCTSLL